jgi:hypothetical protein
MTSTKTLRFELVHKTPDQIGMKVSWLQLGLLVVCLIGIVLILQLFMQTIEPFADEGVSAASELTGLMTQLEESLCPAINEVVKRSGGSSKEKGSEAQLDIVKEVGGPIFPCPAPSDALAIPANIDVRIANSIRFLKPKLLEIMANVGDATNPPCDKKDANEGYEDAWSEPFQDICTDEMDQKKKSLEEEAAAKASAEKCISPSKLSEEDKRRIYQMRIDTLKRYLASSRVVQLGKPPVSVASELAEISALTKQVLDVTSKVDADPPTLGAGSASCG